MLTTDDGPLETHVLSSLLCPLLLYLDSSFPDVRTQGGGHLWSLGERGAGPPGPTCPVPCLEQSRLVESSTLGQAWLTHTALTHWEQRTELSVCLAPPIHHHVSSSVQRHRDSVILTSSLSEHSVKTASVSRGQHPGAISRPFSLTDM